MEKFTLVVLFRAGYFYPDSIRNVWNENLSVINNPDIIGTGCNFAPFSFYLNGKRTYWGLPNNPNYDLGPGPGSVCDTLGLGISYSFLEKTNAALFVYYYNTWQKLFINAQNIKGKSCLLQIFDINGKQVFSSSKQTQPPYFTQDVNVNNLNKGMYLVSLITEREMLVKKFVKEK